MVWGICALILPKLPDFKETLEQGKVVDGVVVSVAPVENITINERHPRRVSFRYGDGQEGSMILAMSQNATEGQAVKVRVLGEHAYPEDLKPLAKPWWLNLVLIAAAAFATLFLGFGVLRLLLVGGALFAGGRALMKKNQESKSPGNSPPPPPPIPPVWRPVVWWLLGFWDFQYSLFLQKGKH
jgi:hypothetical protein